MGYAARRAVYSTRTLHSFVYFTSEFAKMAIIPNDAAVAPILYRLIELILAILTKPKNLRNPTRIEVISYAS
jgi:hypothetical protein